MQILGRTLVLITLTCILAFHTASGSGLDEGWGEIQTDNYANRTLRYQYLIPGSLPPGARPPVLVTVGGLSSPGPLTKEMRRFARERGMVIVAPWFIWDERNWAGRTSYQYPEAWSGRALLDIVADLEKERGLKVGSFYMFGFSAGAQFVLRFALWRPDRCAAVVGHASGGAVTPERYVNVSFRLTVGSLDTSRTRIVSGFADLARTYGIRCETQVYEGMGHELAPRVIGDTLSFFKKEINFDRGL